MHNNKQEDTMSKLCVKCFDHLLISPVQPLKAINKVSVWEVKVYLASLAAYEVP